MLLPSAAAAQEARRFDLEDYRDVHVPQVDCGGAPGAKGDIVVCGQRDETEDYVSVIPPPVDMYGDVREPVDVSTLPPCIHAPPLSWCAKGIGGPVERAVMVDMTAFPAPLPVEEAAAVSRAD
ncbi:hypothetical protein AAW00_09395 [Aurantiacibacter luteus]|uniref:Uncharacterized protein n=2 Tax=Aurantiacibacter luteus TaxID=1581420 RepID=A0A0G9MUM0_9SPHN|nr:hypothetical protein AAW00_09395 [Aurantiacibacter luteus]